MSFRPSHGISHVKFAEFLGEVGSDQRFLLKESVDIYLVSKITWLKNKGEYWLVKRKIPLVQSC